MEKEPVGKARPAWDGSFFWLLFDQPGLVAPAVAAPMVTVAAVVAAPASVVLVHYARRKCESAEYGEGQDVPNEFLYHCRRFFRE
ncbi:hypothetical protein A8B98_21655 [Hymenobacter sp. UV11]|nr:hypothetical protein A8B98_21655 [Hymenobacter sp. UV11]